MAKCQHRRRFHVSNLYRGAWSTVTRCMSCRSDIPFGPANDNDPRVQIDISAAAFGRAAIEIGSSDYVVAMTAMPTATARCGFAQSAEEYLAREIPRLDAGAGALRPFASSYEIGFLARVLYDEAQPELAPGPRIATGCMLIIEVAP